MSPDDPVLIAGGGGFIGGHLAARFERDGYKDVRVVDVRPPTEWHQRVDRFENAVADLRDLGACTDAVSDRRVVFDFASNMGGIGYIESNPLDCMLSVVIGANLIRATLASSVERFFYASSACVYNTTLQDQSSVPGLREDDVLPALPNDGYGWEKLFMELMCEQAAATHRLRSKVARYHNVYGPRGSWVGGREKAPAAICRKVAEAVLNGEHEIEVWGDGEQTRSFLYVDDAVEATLRLTTSEIDEPLNVGSDRAVSINELVDIVEQIAKVSVRRRYLPDAPLGVRGRNSDNTRARERLGWSPAVSLEDGLEATYRWIYDQLAPAA